MRPHNPPQPGAFGKWTKVRVNVFDQSGKSRTVWRGRAKDDQTAIELAGRNYTLLPGEVFQVYRDDWYYGSQANH